MDNIKLTFHNLQDSISAEKREKDVENALMQLHSTSSLLKLSTVPPNTFKRISELLRKRLLPLYQVSLTRALQYSAAVLEFIQDDKLIPALKAKDESLKQLWEQLLISLVSGVLDYLDQSPNTQSRESIVSVLYPILTRIYFSPFAMFLSEIDGGLLSVVYQLLVTTVEPQSRNATRLRDHGISGKCLGLTLSQIRDFLAIESLLEIICILIPPIKNGVEKRSQFIEEVFNSDLFQCSKFILQILESITDGDWSITAVKIIEALANSDISFPQPFDTSSLMICGISLNTIGPFYVDKNRFLASLDQDGKLETLHVPFHTVTRIVGSRTNAEFSVVLELTVPPIIGTEPLSVPSGSGLSVSWRLKKSQLDKFAIVVKARNLIFLNSSTKKLSLPGTHIALPEDKQSQALVSTQERIHDMVKFLANPSSPGPDHAQSNSPVNQQSESCEQRTENTTPSVELVTAIVEEAFAHQTVFLDHNGHLSFTDPLHPVDKVQSLEDNTLLAISSTSELPRRPTQGSTKNQNHNAAVTSRVTRSNNITQHTIQKLPNNKPKKKSAPTKKPPVVKRHSSFGLSQTMTFDGQLRSEILIQGHSAAPIDVDNLEETIPPSKTQKSRSMVTATTDRAVMNPLDELPQPEDLPLEINLSPPDLKPESKKRAIRNIEDNEAIYVTNQERPTKRNRIDTDKPSHPALPYQRKKYGRSGRASSPRAESPAIPTVTFDEIHDPKPTGVERPNSRASALNSKHSGKKTQPKPAAAPKKRKQEPEDINLDVKPIAPEVPVSLAKAERDRETVESLLETDHHEPVEQRTTTGRETEPDCHSTTLTQVPFIAQTITTQGHNENNSRKKAQTTPWEDKNFQQQTDGALDSIRLPSTKGILVQKADETWDHDHSLTLVVDDNDYKQDKEVVELSTLEPDIVMTDLAIQDDPIPAGTPINVFSKLSLKKDISVANIQLALPEKQTQKVKVEMSLPHHLPTKDRDIHRPSVTFASPVESQRYPWTETPTPARKQRTVSDSKSHRIRKSWERSDHKKTTSVHHQQRYAEAEGKGYEEPEEPIRRINEIVNRIGETIVHQILRRFESVRDELHAGHRSILQGTLQHLERMHEESTTHLANMVELEEEYALRCGDILKSFDDIRESSKNVASCVKNIVKEQNQQSLSKKFPQNLFDKRTGILLNATIGSNRLG